MATPKTNTDILSDILDRVALELGCDEKQRHHIERELRRAVGGEMHYIGKTGEGARTEVQQRDARIRSDARRGERLPLLARKHGLSVRRIQQILQMLQDEPGAPGGETIPAKRFA